MPFFYKQIETIQFQGRMINHLPQGNSKSQKRRHKVSSVDNLYNTKDYNILKLLSPKNVEYHSFKNSHRGGTNTHTNKTKATHKSIDFEKRHKSSVNNSQQNTRKINNAKGKENQKQGTLKNFRDTNKQKNENKGKSSPKLLNFHSFNMTPKNQSQTPCTTSHNFLQSQNNLKYNQKYTSHLSSGSSSSQQGLSTPYGVMTYPTSNYLTTSTSTLYGASKMRRQDFKFMYQIGFGGFGKVWKVQQKSNWDYYAMKEIEKRKVIQKDSVDCILNERRILSNLKHPFLVNMKYSFQDANNLYLIMDYLKGADLRYHICYTQIFTQIQTKFILACLLLSLEDLHSKGIVHSDIKPENLVLQQTGYVRLTDFGIAKYLKKLEQNRYDSSGTPGYMAPQVMMKDAYNQISDYFAVGVIGYEMMLGKRPYMGKNRKEIKDKIQNEQAKIQENDTPEGWSAQSVDFINQLLIRDPKKRLGSISGVQDLKNHPWMEGMNWKKLFKKQISPPFVPNIVCESKEYLDEIDSYNELNQEKIEGLQNQKPKILSEEENKMFEGYQFINLIYMSQTEKDAQEQRDRDKNRQKNPKLKNKARALIKVR